MRVKIKVAVKERPQKGPSFFYLSEPLRASTSIAYDIEISQVFSSVASYIFSR